MILRSATASAALMLGLVQAQAADMPAPVAVPVTGPCKTAITFPAYAGVIKQNPDPSCFTTGIGDIYVGGAITGYAYNYSDRISSFYTPFVPGQRDDRVARVDFSNVQAFIQKADGPFQFYIQTGLYSIPALGFPTFSAIDQTGLLFSPLPVVFGKWVINDEWSIQGGRMPTNIGTELAFTFQNLNISRGLLFNQENIINQGVQINYASGPLAASFAVTDGFYSGELNWVTGAITYKLDDYNTIGVNGGTNFSHYDSLNQSARFYYATPLPQQNSSIISANYTYANGPWIVTPYIQYTSVDRVASIGQIGGETFGGAILASYAFTDNFALAGRFEYITQSGSPTLLNRTNILGYGPGSAAYSFTVTPTFTWGRYFIRGEYSHVELTDFQRGDLALGGTNVGFGFGPAGNRASQDRYMVETGFTF
ncbi:porin [Methylobacterium radiodurans]|uniref:Porin n=1 Tax=Methylobacterium radiodurans TaxID=2202828 RepID=A0A2U8VYV4_9HYPH|nr:porin [Methylobacterium radiodurans]